MKVLLFLLCAICFISLNACDSGPKVIEAESTEANPHNHASGTASASDVHQVILEDFLHTEKYTYMDVSEKGERFWIAAPRMEVQKGATYYYAGGLKKTNFKSQEYDRVFETIYLVSQITQIQPGGGSAVDRALAQQQQGEQPAVQVNNTPVGDIVKISDIYANSSKYSGKTVSVKGRCVKINKMIMGRNWVHLDDGTAAGKDLTITTTDDVALNTTVTMTGTIDLNVDFGAGYKYDVIMQNAKVVK